MNKTLTLSVWEDLIRNQRWEELRATLAATHSSDIAEALGQIHGKEQAVVSAFCPATPMLMRYSSRIDANVGITGTELRLAVVFGGCFLTFPKRIIRNPSSGHRTTLGKNALACRVPPVFLFRNPDFHPEC